MDTELANLNAKISYSQVEYPTGKLTIQFLRQRFSDEINDSVELVAAGIDSMHILEKAFVRYGFGSILGGPEGDRAKHEVFLKGNPEDAYKSAIMHLTRLYIHFGVADGPETAKQLIHRLEKSGAELARIYVVREVN